MYRITALCLLAFTVQVNSQELVAHVSMEGVKSTVTFYQSGNDVIGSFGPMTSGLSGNIDVTIRSLWFHYDVLDKCSTTQLGANIASLTTTVTYPNNFTLSSTTLDAIEGRSLVLENGVTACASIQQKGDYITAVAYLRKTVFGDIYFRQHSVQGSTFINSDLKTTAGFSQASWIIAKNDVDCDNLGDPTQIEIFNPANVNGGTCSQAAQSNCAVGNLVAKVGSAQVASESSSNRASYRDSNLPLFGDMSVADKYLIVFDPNNVQNAACAKISVFRERNVFSIFSHGGVEGSLQFRQRSPFDPTLVSVHLQGLSFNAGGYHVHDFPVPVQSVPNENLCHADVVAGHFNPYGISTTNMYPAPQTSTVDRYETGDLSSKHGTLEGFSEYSATNLTDWNLPLFGRNSVVGRSIVIHRNDSSASRWVCSNIELFASAAAAVFTTPVVGHVYFTQSAENPETQIFARLSYIDGRALTTDNEWQISTYKVGRGMNCTSTGMIYNPSGISNDAACSSDSRFCKIGDLSGRHGTIGIGSMGTYAKELYTDSTVHLSGPYSVIGRSVVIMDSSGSNIIACATIQNLHEMKLSAQFDSGSINGKVKFSQMPRYGHIATSVSTEDLNGFNDLSHVLEIRNYPVAGGSCGNLGDVYNPLAVTQVAPQTHDQYKIGDLSRRQTRNTWFDSNLPLSGLTSINGHSLAIIDGGRIIACANIGFDLDGDVDGHIVAAKLDFQGPVFGKIELSQIFYNDETLSDTSIKAQLTRPDTNSVDHNWHVHLSPVAGDATAATNPCASAGPHYDPFMANQENAATNYSTECGLSNPLRCEVGDQALKLGRVDITNVVFVYNDVYLPLDGEYSVQGRSIVIHVLNGGAPRLACADIIPMNGLDVSASFQTPQNFDKRDAARVLANAVNTEEENIVVEVVSQTDEVTRVNLHFLGKDRILLRSRLLSFVDSEINRQSLGDYSTIMLSKARHIISSVVVLVLSLIIGTLMISA